MIVDETRPASGSLEGVFLDERARLVAFLRRLGAEGDAEDILHDAWLRISALDRPMPEEPLSYLYRLLHNLLIDRRRQAQRRLQRDSQWMDVTDRGSTKQCQQPSSERRLLAIDEVRAVHEAIDALGEPAASIFRRHRVQGQTQRMIAAELGMGLSTVEKHLRRAYAALTALRRTDDNV